MKGLHLLVVHLLGVVASTSAFAPIAPRTVVAGSSSRRHAPSNTNNNIICQPSSTTSSSSTSLSALVIPAAVAATGVKVASFYKAFPLLAGFLTTSLKAGVADSMAQYRDVCTTKFNVKRNLAMVLYSGFILGCTVEVMYNRAFPLMFGTTASTVRAIKMTLFDGFINAPLLWLPPAYLAQALVYRYPFKKAIQKYVTDVKENGLLTKYWSLWLPATMTNFSLVPPHFRVAFAASVSFFWMIILSVVANNGKEEEEKIECPLYPEDQPVFLDPRALD